MVGTAPSHFKDFRSRRARVCLPPRERPPVGHRRDNGPCAAGV